MVWGEERVVAVAVSCLKLVLMLKAGGARWQGHGFVAGVLRYGDLLLSRILGMWQCSYLEEGIVRQYL